METVEEFALCVVEETENLIPVTIKRKGVKELFAVTEYTLQPRVRIILLPCEPTDILTPELVRDHKDSITGVILRVERTGGFHVRVAAKQARGPRPIQTRLPKSVMTAAAPGKPVRVAVASQALAPQALAPKAQMMKREEKFKTDRGGQLTTRSKLTEGVLLVEIDGTVDVAGAAVVDRVARRAIRERCHVVLDVGGVEYVPSAGLGVLIALVRDLREKGLGMSLVNVKKTFQRILDISRLGKLVECYGDLEEACKSIADR